MKERNMHIQNLARYRSLETALLLVSISLFSGCGAKEEAQQPNVTVQVVPARRGPIAETVTAEAVIYPLQQAVITPKITSTIRKFYVQRGSRVKQGQLLAELENADLAGAAEQSKGEFQQAEAGYATTTGASLPELIQKTELDAAAAKAAFDAQQKVYEARRSLFEQGAIPRRDLDSAEVALAQSRSQNEQAQKQLSDLQRLGKTQALKSATGQLSAAKGKYLSAEALLSYSEIRSPIDGVITDRPLYKGELATANQPILTVMNTSRLIAKAHIVQNEAVLLKVGDPAQIQFSGAPEPVKGCVMLVSAALDPGSTTIEVWIEAIKPGPELKPGMNVTVEATAKTVENALIVPTPAVYTTPDGSNFVLTAGSDGKAHQAKVKVGIRGKGLAEIQSGLKENEPVITVGGYALPEGTKITIEAAPAAEVDKAIAQADKPTAGAAPKVKE